MVHCHYPADPDAPALRHVVGRSVSKAVLCGLAFVGLLLSLAVLWPIYRSAGAGEPVEEVVLRILRSDQVCLLVTDRSDEEVIIHLEDSDPLFGERVGYVTATVRVYCGLDMSSISPADLSWDGGTLEVRLPCPEVLELAVETDSIRFITKTSGLQLIRDCVLSRNLREDLLRRISSEAMSKAGANLALPDRAVMISRLNAYLEDRFRELAISVRFI